MSGIAMEYAYRMAVSKHLDATASRVIVALGYHAGAASGRSWPAVDTLAAELHVSDRTISQALGRIERSGILEAVRRRGRTTVWIFPAEARWEPRPPAPARGGTPEDGRANPRRMTRQPPKPASGDKGVTSMNTRGAPRSSSWTPDLEPLEPLESAGEVERDPVRISALVAGMKAGLATGRIRG